MEIAQKYLITSMHNEGVLIKDMPAITGINKNQIREFLDSDEFTGTKRNFSWDTKKLREVAKLLKDGKQVQEIADEMNTKLSVIQGAIHYHKLRQW